ncbi:MAG: hypothetical protein Q9195_009466 [Heterodermia aff. obscurata]
MGRRAITDYGPSMVQWMRNRQPRYKGGVYLEMERPNPSYIIDILPPAAKVQHAADTIPSRHLHSSLNKIKHPVNVVKWTPEGRRLLTGSSSGEFTLWNGTGFNFETIMQAHDTAIRAARYSHGEEWLVSADQDGVVKYWQPNFNNVKAIQAHTDPIRDLAFSPNDNKFVTASDDASLKVFDFAGGIEESMLTGHQWDAKTVDWHPTKGLLVSGSKDHQVKLWDPRTGRCLTTLHGHKNTVAKTLFEPSRGQLLATCARDQAARVFDLRMMRDICLLRGMEKDLSTLTWHPIHVNLLTAGSNDGSILHYLLDEPHSPSGVVASLPPCDTSDPANAPPQTIYPAHRIPHAHDYSVWSLDWHPLGHILASGSNDRATRFWTRARPGEVECFNDRYHLGEKDAEAHGTWDRRGGRRMMREEEEQEMEDEAEGLVDQKMPAKLPVIPGLPGLPGLPNIKGGGKSTPDTADRSARAPSEAPNFPPPPPLGTFPPPPNFDPAKLQEMFPNGQFPPPPPPFGMSGANIQGVPPPPPPPAGFGAGFDFSKMPPGMFPPGFQAPPGFPPPPVVPQPAAAGLPGLGAGGDSGGGAAGGRRRAPLPSQQESLMEEQRRGKYRSAR